MLEYFSYFNFDQQKTCHINLDYIWQDISINFNFFYYLKNLFDYSVNSFLIAFSVF